MSRLALADASRVLAFVLERGGTAHCHVTSAGVAGVGLATSAAKSAGEVLMSVPRTLWEPLSASAARSEMASEIARAVDEQVASIGASGSQLADATLLAALLARRVAEPTYAPYLQQIPPPDVPLLWPAALRAALLQGSSAERAAAQQSHLAEALHATVSANAASTPVAAPSFRWAQAVLLSRAHSGDGKPLALVPGLDLLNHGGAGATATVRFNDTSSAFELVATRAHAADEEVLIDYGTRSSHRLLRLYGFVNGGSHGEGGSASGLVPGEEVLLPLLPAAPDAAEGAQGTQAAEVAEAHRQALRAMLAEYGMRGTPVLIGTCLDWNPF